MTNQEILTQAIQKAIDGGWKTIMAGTLCEWQVLKDPLGGSMPYIFTDIVGAKAVRHPFQYIYDHDFAKALWGKGTTFRHKDGTLITIENPNYWKAKLRSMVVAKDPIKYLGEHIT